jgi:signal transduction histidine kinase
MKDELPDHFGFEPTQPPFQPVRRAEQKFNTYQSKLQALGQILPEVCHQVNNCLCTVIVFLDHLIREANLPEDIEIYRTLREFCKKNVEIARRVQEFGNPDNSGSKLINIKDLLEELIDLFKMSTKDIKIELDLEEDVSIIFADPNNIFQAVWNLLINAKYAVRSNKVKLIRISVKQAEFFEPLEFGKNKCRAGNYVIISVWDNGVGIDEELLDDIFKPYITTKSEGFGLGLKIVSDIAKKYGGCVNAISSPEQGTTFNLYLPAKTAD